MTLTTNVDEGQDLAIANGFDSPVAAGSATDLTVQCDGGGSSGTQPITVTITEASTTGIVVEQATITVDVDYQCTGNNGGGGGTGPASFEADDVDADGPTQRFRFNADALGNKDTATIDLSDAQQNAGVDYTGASATLVSGQDARSFGFDDATQEITYQAQGNVGGTLEIELTGFEITGDQGGTAYYSDDQGRSDSASFSVPAIASNGEDVTTDGDVVIRAGETSGDIDAGGDLTAEDASKIDGSIDVDGEVTLNGKVEAIERIDAGGDVTTGAESSVKNDITAETGSVTTGAESTVKGSVDAAESVTVEEKGVIDNDVTAGADVVLQEDAVVKGDVTAGGCVTVETGAEVKGQIDDNCP
ncbi:polymer-forming cytoskeletal protein [Natrinema longum]|uniref:Polymer-forming cytoskeletal protein n=1 Tax=Natrinema longum TaxID=370324 RepID=A0A8A2U6I8_9EURY|nr:polymer-forming cytoskeletal protein [Natrinema longum]MBZ6494403.1 polymer-forming cytoskeletal protein [Natrinema longum]QSW84274.1 polymer-forming cytoskeletal protein [Natrinema longum]